MSSWSNSPIGSHYKKGQADGLSEISRNHNRLHTLMDTIGSEWRSRLFFIRDRHSEWQSRLYFIRDRHSEWQGRLFFIRSRLFFIRDRHSEWRSRLSKWRSRLYFIRDRHSEWRGRLFFIQGRGFEFRYKLLLWKTKCPSSRIGYLTGRAFLISNNLYLFWIFGRVIGFSVTRKTWL